MSSIYATAVFTLNEAMVRAIAGLVDDYEAPREPSHFDLEDLFRRSGLLSADPRRDPAARVGKRKRVQHVLRWALDNKPTAGTRAVAGLVALVRGCGGFRQGSPNFCGTAAIQNCIDAFSGEPVELTLDGVLRPRSLAGLTGRELTEALQSYVRRAQSGFEDSVLVAGTDKDLIEACAAHVLTERFGDYPTQNFPTLLGQAFSALGLVAVPPRPDPGSLQGATAALSVAIYQLGCAVNRLRNRAGSGHGRPFLPELSPAQIRGATEGAGLVAGWLLDALDR